MWQFVKRLVNHCMSLNGHCGRQSARMGVTAHYSWHAREIRRVSKGGSLTPYEFLAKVGIALLHSLRYIVYQAIAAWIYWLEARVVKLAESASFA